MSRREIWAIVKETLSGWSDHKAQKLAASLSYYTIFALAPLLIIVISIVGLVFKHEAAQGQIVSQVRMLMGEQGAEMVAAMVKSVLASRGSGLLATVIGIVTLLVGASGVFGELHDSLNLIWSVPASQTSGWRFLVRDRLLSFTMILGIGFLLLVSLIVSAGLSGLTTYLGAHLGVGTLLWEWANFAVSLGVITILFAMIFKVLPDVHIRWADVWLGGFFTALLFTLGKTIIGLYLGKSSVAGVYGAAGSLVIVLLWVYYSSQILFLGAEFTRAYAKLHGSMREKTA